MTPEEVAKAIERATDGTFVGDYAERTLLGWTNEYDEQGRLVTADPNYITSRINIAGTNYTVTKVRWDVYIWKPEYPDATYTWCWKDDKEKYILYHLDIMPDYVKEYKERKKIAEKQAERDIVEKGEVLDYLINDEEYSVILMCYNKKFAVVHINKVGDYCKHIKFLFENVKNIRILSQIEVESLVSSIKLRLEDIKK